jgi:hypothetical protein
MYNRRSARIFAPVWFLYAGLLLTKASGQVAILQISVVEGEGIVHVPGSRSSRPMVVEITDETGKPVPNAAVSFHVPEDGPSGTFANGLRTEVVTTDQRGRASLRGLQVNRIPGRFQIRIFASKEQARAGTVSLQYIAETGAATRTASREIAREPAPTTPPPPVAQSRPRRRSRWLTLAALAAGGAAAGLLAAGRAGSSTPPATQPPLSIGTPVISLGKP